MSTFKVRFNEKMFLLPWYREQEPCPNSIVICRITEIDDDRGVKVNILDYGNKEGYIALKELSRKKLKSIRSIVRVGEIRPLLVTNVEYNGESTNIDLSVKQLTDIEAIDRIEKYYKLINIIHTWMKYIYKRNIQITDPTNPTDQTYIFQQTEKISSSTLVDEMFEEDIYDHIDEIKKNIPYDIKDWETINELLLWTLPVETAYDSFLNIKKGEKTIEDIFPEFIKRINSLNTEITSERSKDPSSVITSNTSERSKDPSSILAEMNITHSDVDNLHTLIDKSINYEINIKIQLKLTCWSINSLETIKSIINEIIDISKQTDFSYNSILLNSPLYEFVIKSTNYELMNQLFPEKIAIEDSLLGEIIGNILVKYKDIEYEVEIKREDIM